MKVLVTGGFGYVGGRVCAALAVAGHAITVGARGAAPSTAAMAYDIARFDVTDAEAVHRAIADAHVDAIVHLAALNEIDAARDPRLAYAVNCDGTYNVFAAAAHAGVGKVLYMSTFHVYGRSEGYISEQTPTAPAHPYATTHHAAEDIARYFARYRGLASASLRLSNAYGAPANLRVNRWTLVFNDLCRQAVVSGKIVLTTVGGQHRDFVTLHDVSRAVVHALETKEVMRGGEVYNLGGRCSLSIREVADRIAVIAARELGVPITVRAPDGPLAGASVDYDIAKLEATGFALEGRMEDEIVTTLALCRQALAEGCWDDSRPASASAAST